ncbi:MAG: ribosome biogenesis GTPase Der [Pyrinomonadaceae bacterium]|nr:ribosome biogenesis GTPase Der [Pyrinomonadaceae bacterium]
MSRPLIAIVGRPNVGKSTLFNRLTGTRKAIVGDEPGITRDRIYGEVEWCGKVFTLVDTGGIIPDEDALIPANIFKQAKQAITSAEMIIWVVDAREGLTPLDEEIFAFLREIGKPVLIAANKSESKKVEEAAAEFYRFALPIFPVSAEHGAGIGELLDFIVQNLNLKDEEQNEEASSIKVAIIGRPNVGKSSILNRLLGEERVIVSPIPGTTRDAVDTQIQFDNQKFLLIDTAGIRRKGKTTQVAEKLSVIMAKKALQRADIAFLVIDGVEGVTNLDASIAGYALEAGCSIIIVVNKWDAVKEKNAQIFEQRIRQQMKFLDWAPIITVSALTGQRINKLLPLAIKANQGRNLRIPTAKLNKFFEKHVAQPRGLIASPTKIPSSHAPSGLKVQYITQAATSPPLFVLFTSGSKEEKLHFSYLRYIENRLRDEFDFFATPIKLKEKHKKQKRL